MASSVEPPECVVCSNPFHSSLAVPLILTSCGHTICHVCISKLAVTWFNPASQVAGGASTSTISSSHPSSSSASSNHKGVAVRPSMVVQCPECGKRSRSASDGCDGFPRNIELLRLIDALEAVGWTKESKRISPETQRMKNNHTNDVRGTQEESKREEACTVVGQRVGDGLVTVGVSSCEKGGKHQTWAKEGGPHLSRDGDTSAAGEGHTIRQSIPSHAGGTDRVRGERERVQESEVGLAADAGDAQRGDSVSARGEDGEEESREEDEALAAGVEKLWERGRGHAHGDHVSAVLFAGTPPYLFTASYDKTIKVWSCEAPFALLHTLSGPKAKVTALVKTDGNATAGGGGPQLISGDYGGGFCVWDLGESPADVAPALIATWQDQMDWRYSGVTSLATAHEEGGDSSSGGKGTSDNDWAMSRGNRDGEGSVLYSGGGDRTVKAWRLNGRGAYELSARMEGHTMPVVALLVDGEVLLSASWDGTVRLWWRSDCSPLSTLHSSPLPASPSGGSTGASKQPLYRPAGVRCLAMVGSLLLVGREDGWVEVWRGSSSETLWQAHSAAVMTLVPVRPPLLLSGSADGTIKVWRLISGKASLIATVDKAHKSPVSSMCAMSAMGNSLWFASGGADGSLCFWGA